MTTMCECCGINTAVIKDYREEPTYNTNSKYLVCANCFNLNDYWFFQLIHAEDQEEKNEILETLLTTESN